MCGIIGIVKHKNCSVNETFLGEFANILLQELQTRGKDATGFAGIWKNQQGLVNLVVKQGIEAEEFRHMPQWEMLEERFPDLFIGHVRMGTGGKAEFNRNNHPFYSADGKRILIHNGVVSGFPKEGCLSDCDTERMLRMIEKEGDTLEGMKSWFDQKGGSFACMVLDSTEVEEPKLFLTKDEGRPIVMYIDFLRGFTIYCSEEKIIEKAYDRMYLDLRKEHRERGEEVAKKKGEVYKYINPFLILLEDVVYVHNIEKIKPKLLESRFEKKWARGSGNAKKAIELRKKEAEEKKKKEYVNRYDDYNGYNNRKWENRKSYTFPMKEINIDTLERNALFKANPHERICPGMKVVYEDDKSGKIETAEVTGVNVAGVYTNIITTNGWIPIAQLRGISADLEDFNNKNPTFGFYAGTKGWSISDSHLSIDFVNSLVLRFNNKEQLNLKEIYRELNPLPLEMVYLNLFRCGDFVKYGVKDNIGLIINLDWNIKTEQYKATIADMIPKNTATGFYPTTWANQLAWKNKDVIDLNKITEVIGRVDWTSTKGEISLKMTGRGNVYGFNEGTVTRVNFGEIYIREEITDPCRKIYSFTPHSFGEIANDLYFQKMALDEMDLNEVGA